MSHYNRAPSILGDDTFVEIETKPPIQLLPNSTTRKPVEIAAASGVEFLPQPQQSYLQMSLHEEFDSASAYPTNVPKLVAESNFHAWWEQIIMHLELNNMGPALDDSATTYERSSVQAIHDKAVVTIRASLHPYLDNVIRGYKMANRLLDFLRNKFKPRGFGALRPLWHRFTSCKLVNYKDVTQYTNEFCYILHDMRLVHNNIIMPESLKVQAYLDGLGPSYHDFIDCLPRNNELADKTHPDFINLCQIYDMVRLEEAVQAIRLEEATQAASRKSSTTSDQVKHCNHCNRNNYDEEECSVLRRMHKKRMQRRRKRFGSDNRPSRR